MIIRGATVADVEQITIVRFAVKENVLSNPALVTEKDNIEYLTVRGKGWVCEIENSIVGFSIVDLKDHSIWALFVLPEHEAKGIGKKLQDVMLNYYFSQSKEKLWLETAADTRAENFYKASGWKEISRTVKQRSIATLPPYIELKLELTFEDWITHKSQI